MDGEANETQGGQDTNGAESQAQPDGAQERPAAREMSGADAYDATAYEAQIAERDTRIAELEAQVADVAKSAEAADELRSHIEELKRRGEEERVDFALQLAGVRNVKAARAVLGDHGGDIEALRAAEPWLFADGPAKAAGKTGLSNAGTASDEGRDVKRWRSIAGLDDGNER